MKYLTLLIYFFLCSNEAFCVSGWPSFDYQCETLTIYDNSSGSFDPLACKHVARSLEQRSKKKHTSGIMIVDITLTREILSEPLFRTSHFLDLTHITFLNNKIGDDFLKYTTLT